MRLAMKKRQPSSVTIHCWWPNWNIVAAGLLIGAAGLSVVFQFIGEAFPFAIAAKVCGGLMVLGYWCLYCRVTVTPWEVRVLGSGLWKGRYRSPLEEVIIGGQWALGEAVRVSDIANAGLFFGIESDWDTDITYVEMQFYGEDILNAFREQHYPKIQAAIEAMVAQRQALEAATIE